jgi:hypothetical protein
MLVYLHAMPDRLLVQSDPTQEGAAHETHELAATPNVHSPGTRVEFPPPGWTAWNFDLRRGCEPGTLANRATLPPTLSDRRKIN